MLFQRPRRPPTHTLFPYTTLFRSADKMFVFAGILVSVLSALVLLHNADRIFRKIGRTGARAFGRIMGLLLAAIAVQFVIDRSEEHTSELQSLTNIVCRLLLEKKNI